MGVGRCVGRGVFRRGRSRGPISVRGLNKQQTPLPALLHVDAVPPVSLFPDHVRVQGVSSSL